jgi:hypothetical protein
MLAVDDTGRPPTAAAGGGILAVPEAALPDLWRRVDMDQPEHLAHASFPTDTDLVAALGGELAPVDDQGHFRLVAAGPHLVCRLHATVTADSPPAATSGCALVRLPASGELTASYGEGGFHAKVENP